MKVHNSSDLHLTFTSVPCPFICPQFRLGCAIFATFFIPFEANLSKYGSSSLHIRMFSVYSQTSLQTGEYLLQNICLEANIRKTLSKFNIQANIRLQIFAYQRMFAMYCFKFQKS